MCPDKVIGREKKKKKVYQAADVYNEFRHCDDM